MFQRTEAAHVVVGTDGSLPSRRAVAYAAAEAARRGLALRIVHATPWIMAGRDADGLRPRIATWTLSDTDAVLNEAADLAAQCLPADRVSTVTGIGWPAAVLLGEARRAAMLVVGHRGLGGFAGLFLGSVGVEVTGHASCPVLIVRQPSPEKVVPDAPVVVGVDGSGRSDDALRAAFEAADLAGAPLVALHAWRTPALVGPAQLPVLAYQNVHRPADEKALLEAVLEPYLARFPNVQVSADVIEGHPGAVLTEASASARLLVVASRGHGEIAGLVLGSTSQAAIHHAQCPVLVVPPAHR